MADVILAVMSGEQGVGQYALNQLGVAREDIVKLQQQINPPTVTFAIQHTAESESRAMQHPYIGTEHLVLAAFKMLEGQPSWPDVYRFLTVDHAAVKAAVLAALGKPAK